MRPNYKPKSKNPLKSVWVKKAKKEGALRYKVKGPYEVVDFKYPVVTVRVGDMLKRHNMNQCRGAYKAPPGYLDDDGVRPDTNTDTTHLWPEPNTQYGAEEEDDEVEFNMDTEDDEEADEAEELEAKLAKETSASSKPHYASSQHPQTESNIEEMLKLCKPLGVSLDKVDV